MALQTADILYIMTNGYHKSKQEQSKRLFHGDKSCFTFMSIMVARRAGFPTQKRVFYKIPLSNTAKQI